jgi:CheY-like chemotaxis protein
VVDDESTVAAAVMRALSSSHEVVTAGNGREALHLVHSGQRFDVLLCDLLMPEMTGMDLHAELRRSDPALAERMVFMTGSAFTPAAKQFLEEVTTPRIEKPFDIERLRALVNSRIA